jgi:hypothetical protein
MASPSSRPVSEDEPTIVIPTPATTPRLANVLVPLAIGELVAVVLGAFGWLHQPANVPLDLVMFSGPLEAKVWLASAGFVLALGQGFSALVMFGKVPRVPAPSWIGTAHRWLGRLAFLLVVPVAVHCLYSVGFQTFDARTLIHSIVGCFFFGAFTVKMLVLPRRDLPGWVLPLVGGLVFTGLVVLWLTSSLWFFTTVGVRF